MKHLHTFEGKNTKDWYCKILSKNNTKETFFDFFYKIQYYLYYSIYDFYSIKQYENL